MPSAADRPDRALRSGHTRAANGSTVSRQLALRPEFLAQARMPPTALHCATRERRGLLIFDCGPWRLALGGLPRRPGGWSLSGESLRVHAVFLSRDPTKGGGKA
jgi:hypothetical protein